MKMTRTSTQRVSNLDLIWKDLHLSAFLGLADGLRHDDVIKQKLIAKNPLREQPQSLV